MKLTNKDYEEILTINEQAKALVPRLDYCDELAKEIFDCMKNKKTLQREYIQKAHNNYLALAFFIGINNCNTATFEKLDKYMDNEY